MKDLRIHCSVDLLTRLQKMDDRRRGRELPAERAPRYVLKPAPRVLDEQFYRDWREAEIWRVAQLAPGPLLTPAAHDVPGDWASEFGGDGGATVPKSVVASVPRTGSSSSSQVSIVIGTDGSIQITKTQDLPS